MLTLCLFCKDTNIMRKIYFEKRCIVICSPDDQALADPNAVEFHLGRRIDIHALVRMFELSRTLRKLYIPDEDTEGTYRRLCAEFKEVNAAGGLVRNRRGDYLLIKRNGLWDLPKGHQEAGEDIRVTALREVRVIAGWTEALQLMSEGSEWELYIPYNLAYGETGAHGAIPPYAALIFKVELIEVL